MNYAALCEGMSAMAATHPNDTISNALARVSRKLESHGTSKFAPELTAIDMQVIQYYKQIKGKQYACL
jgi:hypothetical protein